MLHFLLFNMQSVSQKLRWSGEFKLGPGGQHIGAKSLGGGWEEREMERVGC